jgi:hypothetical protein
MFAPPVPEAEYQKPIDERMEGHIIATCDYQKHSSHHPIRQTGTAVKMNEVPFFVIVDIDINKKLNADARAAEADRILASLSGCGARLVRSGHGGIHIYCNQGETPLADNRDIKCIQTERFAVDLFGCVDSSKESIVLLPESEIRDGETSPILTYRIIEDPPGGILQVDVATVLKILDVVLPPIVVGKRGKKVRKRS